MSTFIRPPIWSATNGFVGTFLVWDPRSYSCFLHKRNQPAESQNAKHINMRVITYMIWEHKIEEDSNPRRSSCQAKELNIFCIIQLYCNLEKIHILSKWLHNTMTSEISGKSPVPYQNFLAILNQKVTPLEWTEI